MAHTKEVISIQEYYLKNFYTVINELISRLEKGEYISQEEKESYSEELLDYAKRGNLPQASIDKLYAIKDIML